MVAGSRDIVIGRLKKSGMHSRTSGPADFPKEPYKGLSYFSVADGPIFGQRDRQTEACLGLLNNSRVLILHGQSGAGKSSFLRAGLLRSVQSDQRFLTLANIDNPSDAYVVRATGDPIYRLRRALEVALRKDTVIREWLTTEYADTLSEELGNEPIDDILKKICKRLPVPLIIAIDQAEEILTAVDATITRPLFVAGFPTTFVAALKSWPAVEQGLGEDQPKTPKERFFGLIEKLCCSDIQLKLIVTIRTEYYGQFCDNFRLPPDTPLSPIKSGVESYWLSGLHTKDELTEAILLPQREFSNAALKGIQVEPFKIDSDLPKRLVDDLVATKGAASALPILQLVCKELHAVACIRAKKDGGPIRLRTADITKGVAGVVDNYINEKVRDLEKIVRGPRRNISSDKWRTVLVSLVGRQEGGVLITLLTPLAELSRRCEAAGLRPVPDGGFRLYLDALCATGLLRSVNYGDAKEPEYSLGHDALAPYLYRWHLHEATARLTAEKFRRRALACSAVAIAVLMGAAVAFYGLWVVPEKQELAHQFVGKVSNALDQASLDVIQDASSRLRPGLFALSQFQGTGWVDQNLHTRSRQTLASLIQRTPVRVGCADALGIQDPLNDSTVKVTSIAFLNKTETCFDGFSEESRVASGRHVTTAQLGNAGDLVQTSDLSFPVAENPKGSEKRFFSIPFVGFLNHNSTPVIVVDRMISLRSSDASFNHFAVEKVFTDESPRFLLFDASEGALWANGGDPNTKRLILQRAELVGSGNQFQPVQIDPLPQKSLMWPVFSPWKPWLADIGQQSSELQGETLEVRDRTGEPVASWELPTTEWRDPVSFVVLRNQPIRPAGFVRNTNWLAVRTGRNDIVIYDVRKNGSVPTNLVLPKEVSGAPLRPAWFNRRPPLAGELENGVLTLAWATRRGIEVVRWSLPSGSAVPEAPLIYSPDAGATIADLRFLPGHYLLVTISEPGTFAIGFRLMDLDPKRRAAIESLDDAAMLRAACDRLKANNDTSSEVTKICQPLGG